MIVNDGSILVTEKKKTKKMVICLTLLCWALIVFKKPFLMMHVICVVDCFPPQRELVLYPNKNGKVQDLLDEARKQVELFENGTGKLRWVTQYVTCRSFPGL